MIPDDTAAPVRRPPARDLARPAWAWLLSISGVLGAVLIATSRRYGYHRDELYFLAAGRRLAWGYVDQPPLTPLLARLADETAGGSLPVLRLPAALAAAATVLLVGLTARELGGGKLAQVVAVISAAVSAYVMIVGHMLSTTSIDLLVWTAVGYLVARILNGAPPRLWLVVGAVAGIGMLNKTLVALLGVALAAGLAIGARPQLRSRWLWAGAALALLIALPNLIWQARHGWPQLEMAAAIRDREPFGGRLVLLPFQLIVVAPPLAPLWIAGLVRLLRSPAQRPFRAIGWTYLALVGIVLITGGQPYYPAGWYGPLLAAGAVGAEAWLAGARPRARRVRSVLLAGVLVLTAVVTVPLALPLLPARQFGASPLGAINSDALETIGWPEFTRQVRAAWDALPPEQRRHAVVLTGNYGEAGALEHFAGGDLPVVSGHNSYSDWDRPPPGTTTALVVGISPDQLHQLFATCTSAGRIDNHLGLANEEQGKTIWRCDSPADTWTALWPRIRHYN